jgi:hypothetical protein
MAPPYVSLSVDPVAVQPKNRQFVKVDVLALGEMRCVPSGHWFNIDAAREEVRKVSEWSSIAVPLQENATRSPGSCNADPELKFCS